MDIYKRLNFLYGLSITLGTIVIGLISYVFYSEHLIQKQEPSRCEYNGWAYADREIFDSIDSCNTCFCDDGSVVCTQKACLNEQPELCEDGTTCPVD